MVKLLNEGIHKQLSEIFKTLKKPVVLLFFSDKNDPCETCEQVSQLLEEVSSTSNMIGVKQFSIEDDPKVVEKYGIDKTPAIVLCTKEEETLIDQHIHFYGIPSGMEFETFIQTILMVSKNETDLEKETVAFLQALKKPVHLQVFVTPT
jgi:alkyl hydroperoxide reductase subunit AhpF